MKYQQPPLNPLPSRVPRLLGPVAFDQPPVGLGWFVIEMDPPDRIDAGELAGDAQTGGDPLGLNQGFDVEVELELGGSESASPRWRRAKARWPRQSALGLKICV